MSAAAVPGPEAAEVPALLTLAGTRCDLGFDAARVRQVLDARELGPRLKDVVDLFARIGEGTRDGGRVVVVARSGGGELLVRAPGAIAVVTPRALLPLPRIVTRYAPFLAAVAALDEPGVATPDPAARARPLFLVAEERIAAAGADPAENAPVSKISELW